jgi:hypothetical protein
MSRFAAAASIALLGTLSAVQASEAVEWAVVGARAAGMGGAGVAVTSDALATYWNPAGLAMTKTVDVRLQLSAQAVDRMGLKDTIDDIKNFNTSDPSLGNIDKANDIANRINRPGSTLSAIAAGGLYFKGYIGEHAFGFNVSDVATAGMFVSRPVRVTCAGAGSPACGPGSTSVTLEGQMALNGLEARQAVASYAYAFMDRMFSIGISGKLIQGAAYTGTASIQGGNDVSLSDNLGKAKTSTAFGIDAGAMFRPSSWLRAGIVAKDINRPSFDAPNGDKFRLDPQVRGGIAVNPWETLTLTADADVTSNRTLVPNLKSRMISVGAEQTMFSELFSLRVGAFKNTADANSYVTPTAGFGIRVFALRVDVGGGYDFRERGALASGTVGMTF